MRTEVPDNSCFSMKLCLSDHLHEVFIPSRSECNIVKLLCERASEKGMCWPLSGQRLRKASSGFGFRA